MTSTEQQSLMAIIRAEAAAKHAQYPQYAGHWDGAEWFLVHIRRQIGTKMGAAFAKGEIAMAKYDPIDLDADGMLVVYSRANGTNTMVQKSDAVALAEMN